MHRVVRVPPPRAASRRRPRAVHRRGAQLRAAQRHRAGLSSRPLRDHAAAGGRRRVTRIRNGARGPAARSPALSDGETRVGVATQSCSRVCPGFRSSLNAGLRIAGPRIAGYGCCGLRGFFCWKRACIRRKTGPGRPPANGLPSTVVTASTSFVDDDSHISSAPSASALGTGRISKGRPASRANSSVGVVGDAGQDQVVLGRGHDAAGDDDQHVRGRGFGEQPVAEHHGLDRAGVGGKLAHQHVADERDRLQVAAPPAVVLGGDHRHALLDLLGRRRRQRIAHHEHGLRDVFRERVVALGHAARHLQVDALMVEGLPRDQLADERLPLRVGVRVRQADAVEAAAAGARDAAAGGTAAGGRRAPARRRRRRR